MSFVYPVGSENRTGRLSGSISFYRDCQKNIPIEDHFSATTPYAAILFSEHDHDKRYKSPIRGYCPLSIREGISPISQGRPLDSLFWTPYFGKRIQKLKICTARNLIDSFTGNIS